MELEYLLNDDTLLFITYLDVMPVTKRKLKNPG